MERSSGDQLSISGSCFGVFIFNRDNGPVSSKRTPVDEKRTKSLPRNFFSVDAGFSWSWLELKMSMREL